jgi:(p)ppGpp synthase/HD superfamily hydrolase
VATVPGLGPLEEEVERKNASMLGSARISELELLDICALSLGRADFDAVSRTLAFVKSLESVSADHPSVAAYLSHPMRVARITLSLQAEPSVEAAHMALLHNVFEVCGLDELSLREAGYADRVGAAIRCLTINREQESDVEYLARFYGAIEEFGDPLPLIRVVDKLDNLLGLGVLEEGQLRESYIDLAALFVAPTAHRIDPALGRYFDAVVAHARDTACRPK